MATGESVILRSEVIEKCNNHTTEKINGWALLEGTAVDDPMTVAFEAATLRGIVDLLGVFGIMEDELLFSRDDISRISNNEQSRLTRIFSECEEKSH